MSSQPAWIERARSQRQQDVQDAARRVAEDCRRLSEALAPQDNGFRPMPLLVRALPHYRSLFMADVAPYQSLDTRAFYEQGPAGRAVQLRRERDHARDLACALEQELARHRIDLPRCEHGYFAARCPTCKDRSTA